MQHSQLHCRKAWRVNPIDVGLPFVVMYCHIPPKRFPVTALSEVLRGEQTSLWEYDGPPFDSIVVCLSR